MNKIKFNLQDPKELLIKNLDCLTQELKDVKNRKSNDLSLDLFEQLKEILEKFNTDSEIIIPTLRILRNASVNSSQNQKFLYQSTIVQLLIQGFLNSESYETVTLQVLGNSVVGNTENAKILLELLHLEPIIAKLEKGDVKIGNFAAMVGMNLSQGVPNLVLENVNSDITQTLMDHVNLEYVVLWLEYLISIPGFVAKVYPNLTKESKVNFFLFTNTNWANFGNNFPQEALEYLISIFKKLADQILTTNPNGFPSDFNVLEITTMTELFCKVVQNPTLRSRMKKARSFVASITILLRTIHEIGTSGQNSFTPIEKLEDLDMNSKEVCSEPGFMFKCDLIRLIGSMVEDDRENQDQVRELGCLPVILNCTKVDGRNPFIPQCSIVTLKFLLDRNQQNQEYIKNLQKN